MSTAVSVVILVAIVVHLLLISVAVWRVWRGENVVDRLVGADLVSVLALAVFVLLALAARQSIYVDVALGLAALGFISTILLARYIADDRAA